MTTVSISTFFVIWAASRSTTPRFLSGAAVHSVSRPNPWQEKRGARTCSEHPCHLVASLSTSIRHRCAERPGKQSHLRPLVRPTSIMTELPMRPIGSLSSITGTRCPSPRARPAAQGQATSDTQLNSREFALLDDRRWDGPWSLRHESPFSLANQRNLAFPLLLCPHAMAS